jgi:hypothetical protein
MNLAMNKYSEFFFSCLCIPECQNQFFQIGKQRWYEHQSDYLDIHSVQLNVPFLSLFFLSRARIWPRVPFGSNVGSGLPLRAVDSEVDGDGCSSMQFDGNGYVQGMN